VLSIQPITSAYHKTIKNVLLSGQGGTIQKTGA
jgi:hypothetical protein